MKKLVVGNWKLYPTLPDSLVLAAALKRSLAEIQGVDVAIAPPTGFLVPIAESWNRRPSHIALAAQNVWPEDQGAFTGQMSVYLLKNIIGYAIVGHSECRRDNQETSELVSRKAQSCLRWGVTPIVCVGETKRMINADGHFDADEWAALSSQLLDSLAGVNKEVIGEVAIAYEPVWAIGGHNPAKPDYVAAVISRLRQALVERFGSSAGETRFLYGGSVSAENAGDYLRQIEINGVLAGTISVKARDFLTICRLAATLG